MTNAYQRVKRIAKENKIGREEAITGLLATVFAECCDRCHERFHSEEFLDACEKMIQQLRLCRELSKKNVA